MHLRKCQVTMQVVYTEIQRAPIYVGNTVNGILGTVQHSSSICPFVYNFELNISPSDVLVQYFHCDICNTG